jgi:hypothetical protein
MKREYLGEKSRIDDKGLKLKGPETVKMTIIS